MKDEGSLRYTNHYLRTKENNDGQFVTKRTSLFILHFTFTFLNYFISHHFLH